MEKNKLTIAYSKLIESLEDTFINQGKYFFDKHVPEFVKDGKFLGDYFNQIAVETFLDRAPRFYHTFSPFDVVSNKAPHQAVVFENGELVLDIEFDGYVSMRTAAMNAVVFRALGVTDLRDKNVLLFGSGKIATEAIKILASELSLAKVDVITKSGDLTRIRYVVDGVTISEGSVDDISKYDVIICHTKTTEPVISRENIQNIKHGAVLTSFISSTIHGEYPDEIYTSDANIITDWENTFLSAKDMSRAKDSGAFSDVIYMKDLLSGKGVDKSKKYTVYRSTGTPIQNLAILREVLNQNII